MLIINTRVNGCIQAGPLKVTLTDLDPGKEVCELTLEAEDEMEIRTIKRGERTMLYPDIQVVLDKLIPVVSGEHKGAIMASLGFDAPQDIKIKALWLGKRRRQELSLSSLTDTELCRHTFAQSYTTPLERELAARLDAVTPGWRRRV